MGQLGPPQSSWGEGPESEDSEWQSKYAACTALWEYRTWLFNSVTKDRITISWAAALDPRLLMSFDWYFSLRATLLAEDTIEIDMVDKLS